MVSGILRKAWWAEIQRCLEVIENILQRHFLRNVHPPTAKERNTIFSRIFRRIQIVKSASARTLRELLAERIVKIKMATMHARQNLVMR